LLSSPQSEKENNKTDLASNAGPIREQLRRLLARPLFTNRKRYPVLLAYTIEQTILGNASELKERTIGVGAFGREPDYDVNLNPVVRTTAAEVRKRLTQYYYNPDHAARASACGTGEPRTSVCLGAGSNGIDRVKVPPAGAGPRRERRDVPE
jgi:hypothetical protein